MPNFEYHNKLHYGDDASGGNVIVTGKIRIESVLILYSTQIHC